MPRATQSKESQILDWFKHAPLAVAVLILGMAKDLVRERQPKARPTVKELEKILAPPATARAKATPVHVKPAKRRKRVRRKAARGQVAVHTGAATLDDLGPDDTQG